MTTATANLVILNRCTEVFHDSAAFASFHCKTVDEAAAVLSAYGSEVVTVRFSTSEQHLASDVQKYTRRVEKISAAAGYTPEPFAARVVNGLVLATSQEAVLRRSV